MEEPAVNFYPVIPPYLGVKTLGKVGQGGERKPQFNRDVEDTILKMAELKKSTSKYFSPNEVRRILLEVEVRCQICGGTPAIVIAIHQSPPGPGLINE